MLKNLFYAGILKVRDENNRIWIQDPDPYPLVRGMDPRIRIHTKMSWIRNTANIVRKEYDERAELRRIRGMRVADFLAEHDNPAQHFMATDTPVREAGADSGPGPKRIELDSVFSDP